MKTLPRTRRPLRPPERALEPRIGFQLARVMGIPIRVDWSVLIVFGLIVYNLGAFAFPRWHPDWSAASCWLTALLAAVLFLGSILAHELAHALAARQFGIPTRSVTLFLLGGLADIRERPSTPGAEFVIAAIGPITSLAIGFVTIVVAVAFLDGAALANVQDAAAVEAILRDAGVGATLLFWLGPINLVLAAFNAIPAFPLDGGRVFRSLVWALTGDYGRATRWAAGTGRVFAWLLIAVGVMEAFGGRLVEGLWLVLIGWFLNNAAQVSFFEQLLREMLRDVPVLHVMRSNLVSVLPEMALDEFVRERLFTDEQLVYPVESDGELLGLVSAHEVRSISAPRWPTRTVAQVMTPIDAVARLALDATAEDAFEALQQGDVDAVVVVDRGSLRGLVYWGDLLKWLTLYERFPRRRLAIPRTWSSPAQTSAR